MEIEDRNKKRSLDNLTSLVFKDLNSLFNGDLWHDHGDPFHDMFIRFLWGYYLLFCDPDFT
jgi:hypothetical protein